MAFQTQRRVEFRDTDAAGIVHFSSFFPMMEAAEHEMLRSLGISVMPNHETANEPVVTWPRIAADCQYKSAARFEDLLDISIQVVRIGSSSVTYEFAFDCGERRIAVGKITAVCCHLTRNPDGPVLEKCPIPDSLREKLESI